MKKSVLCCQSACCETVILLFLCLFGLHSGTLDFIKWTLFLRFKSGMSMWYSVFTDIPSNRFSPSHRKLWCDGGCLEYVGALMVDFGFNLYPFLFVLFLFLTVNFIFYILPFLFNLIKK